jgi:hypothetical protein
VQLSQLLELWAVPLGRMSMGRMSLGQMLTGRMGLMSSRCHWPRQPLPHSHIWLCTRCHTVCHCCLQMQQMQVSVSCTAESLPCRQGVCLHSGHLQ